MLMCIKVASRYVIRGNASLLVVVRHSKTLLLTGTTSRFSACSLIKLLCYINTNEIPGELSRENMISSHVKITCENITVAMAT